MSKIEKNYKVNNILNSEYRGFPSKMREITHVAIQIQVNWGFKWQDKVNEMFKSINYKKN